MSFNIPKDRLITVLYVIHAWWGNSRYGREAGMLTYVDLSWSNELKATGLAVWSWRCFMRPCQIYYMVFPAYSHSFPCALNPSACYVCIIVACKYSLSWLIDCLGVGPSAKLFVCLCITCCKYKRKSDTAHVRCSYMAQINQSFKFPQENYFIVFYFYSVLL